MNEQNTQQNNALAGLTIQTDIALWRLLLQGIKKSHKLSRVEAFYDLIDRHCIAMLKGEDDHISGTIHNMAKAWGWDRAKVHGHLQSQDCAQSLGYTHPLLGTGLCRRLGVRSFVASLF